ncbi:MAG: FliO/MopB family protein [Phycisphaerae bacterium]
MRSAGRVICGALLLVAACATAVAQADLQTGPVDPTQSDRPSWEKLESELLPDSSAGAKAENSGAASPADVSTAASAAKASDDGHKPLLNREREKQPLQRSAATVATSGSWMRTLLSLLIVIGLVLVLAWGYRSVAMGATPLTPRGRTGGVIQIIGRQSISPRHAVCLVRVGPRLVLVGQSQDRLTQLDVIDDAAIVSQLVGESSTIGGRAESAAFQKQLEREAAAYEPAAARDAPVQGALARMQAALRQAVGK